MNIQIFTKPSRFANHTIQGTNNAIYFDYKLDAIDYFFENQQFIFFLDTNLSKERTNEIQQKFDELNTLNASGISKILHGNYFMVAFDKRNSIVYILRDASGIKTGYFTQTEDSIIIGSVMHDVACKRGNVQYNKAAISQLLFSNYLLNGYTIYKEVEELKMGYCLAFDFELNLLETQKEIIQLAKKDNHLSPQENFQKLRKETRKAHRSYLSQDNRVFLSGGLDSIAMLVALDDLEECENLDSISFRVKGTTQDETVYAQSIAQHLNISNRIKEVDAKDEQNIKNFEQRILKMNNPYFGMWIFGNFKGTPNQMFYAGQDTRLHTPALNEVDKLAFKLLRFRKTWWMKYVVSGIASIAIGLMDKLAWDKKQGMIFSTLYKAAHIFDIEKYVQKFYLKLDKEKMRSKGLPIDHFDEFQKHFSLDFDTIKTPRALYNKLVELKWQEQYTYDMRYLQDVARCNNTYIAMPFYNKELAEFSSSIPFDLSTKAMLGRARFGQTRRIIYKYVLRYAFKDKLNDLVFYRAKAVSETLHQLFNGALGAKVRNLLELDLNRNDSFIRLFKLENYTQEFLSKDTFGMGDYDLLARIYYISTLTIYHKYVFRKNRESQKNQKSQSLEKTNSFSHLV